ncbi:GH1 family beta-glucosidase [Robinsoniella peoriensis]|uniref:GH1 family beta-glucosidase n=1 Tax=Robinsoniella peoriensis TaxID=180332 RepID=UPI00085BE62E|nr:GH1 family beta-glucosidase [Robinsoniella peoriensis]
MGFRDDFLWGTATAAYQVEGAAKAGGRGYTVWDDFCARPGKVYDGHNGEEACDHYRRFREDVDLMAELGIKSYRFSIAWSRILPDGTGKVNEEGIRFYRELMEALLEKNIKPCVTLFHWDLPFALYIRGGWQNPDCVNWFAQYARTVAHAYRELVSMFITFNEPQCFVGLGQVTGEHAPGDRLSRRSALLMTHHVMMAHGAAVQAIRSEIPNASIGYAPTSTVACPLDESQENIRLAKEMYFSIPQEEQDSNYLWSVSMWSDPVLLGRYPQEAYSIYGADMPDVRPQDLELMAQPLDFYAQNIYHGYQVKAGPDGKPVRCDRKQGLPKTCMDWPVMPESLYWGPKFLYERYHLPIVISENGMSNPDVICLDGKVHDSYRIDFLNRYLLQLRRAAEDGVDIRGYYVWSLMDNFEWTKGYSERFGMVHVDYETQKRTIKDSGRWYAKVIESRGTSL